MRDEVKSRGVKFLVVTLSNGIQVHPDPQGRRAFMQNVGATDLFYPDQRIRALCEREGINVLTLAPVLQSYAEQQKVFLHGFDKNIGSGHWNALGHRIAGELIARKICEGLQ
jgi:diphthamide synthase (EF-2-diphthine--ammonia ligase)